MLEEVVLYFCRYVIKNILKFFKNLMKIKNWIVVVEKFKEDEMYILLKKMVVRLRMLYVKMKVFILESFVEKVFGDWVVDWIFI